LAEFTDPYQPDKCFWVPYLDEKDARQHSPNARAYHTVTIEMEVEE